MTHRPVKSRPKASKPHRKATVSSVFGEIILTIGALMLLFAFYEAYWTNLEAGQKQQEVSSALDEKWEEDKGKRVNPRQKLDLELGEAFARMYIPTFGSDFHFAVVEGTNEDDLLRGPGRYVDTQMPGEEGNFAVAGHRVGKGAPFNDLDNLKACDAIVVETQTEWLTYRVMPIEGDRTKSMKKCLDDKQLEQVTQGKYANVVGRHITLPGDVSVLDKIPGSEEKNPTEKLLTLTTCHPQFSNAERMIIHAIEVESQPKKDGERPAALEEN